MNWRQEITASSEREQQQRQGLDRPFAIFVNSVSSDTERMKVKYYGNTDKEISLPHPFIAGQAWIRAVPETGSSFVATFRSDEAAPQALNTFQRNTEDRISAYQSGIGLYRPLYPGELETSSSGGGQFFVSRRATAEMRAGSIQRFADQDKMWVMDRAPTYKLNMLGQASDVMGDELRIGIISRPKNTWEIEYPKVNGNFATEYYLSLLNPSGSGPAELILEQKGHVLDDLGEIVLQTKTQNALRLKESYYANDDSYTTIEIDEKGNYYMQLADAAVEGYALNIPNGNYEIQIGADEVKTVIGGQKFSITEAANYTYGNNVTIDIDQAFSLKAGSTVAIGTSAVELLKEISQTLTKIATWAGTVGAVHTHIGNLGLPTLPPTQAAGYMQLQTDMLQIQSDIESIRGTLS